MNVGLWFTEDTYTGGILPCAGYMNTGGGKVGRKSGSTLGRYYFKGDIDPHVAAAGLLQLDANYKQFGNEPNLPFEGNWTRDSYKQRFMQVRQLVPGMQLGYAGMSPGGTDGVAWLGDAQDAGANFVVAHIYGQTYEALCAGLDAVLAASALPVAIGECNFGPGPGVNIDKNVWARTALRPFLLQKVRTTPRVFMSLYFADTWKADTPIGTSVDARGTAIMNVLNEAANLATDWNIGTGFKKVRDQLGWTPLENEVYHFENNPTLKASMAVFDLGHATWDPRSNETVAIANDGTVYSDGGNHPIDPEAHSMVQIWPRV